MGDVIFTVTGALVWSWSDFSQECEKRCHIPVTIFVDCDRNAKWVCDTPATMNSIAVMRDSTKRTVEILDASYEKAN